MANARYSLIASGNIGPRLVFIYFITAAFFFVGNFSWRLFGILIFKKKLPIIYYFILFNIVVLSLIPVFFIQKGTSWNTIQFLYYALFLSNIFLVRYIDTIKHLLLGKILIYTIVLTSCLGFLGNLPNYLGKIPPSSLPSAEIKALSFLRQLPPGIVLTFPYDQYLKDSFPQAPIPLYAYETTAYVSAFSHHYTFLEDEMNLGNSLYDISQQKKAVSKFFDQKNIHEDRGFLINNQISYIYLTDKQLTKTSLDIEKLFLKIIYDQDSVRIYQVLR